MSDPYTHQGVNRMFPGSLGGRSRVASPVSPVQRQKFTYPAAPVPAGPFWYAMFSSEIDRFDWPSGDNGITVNGDLPISGTRPVYMCGTGGNLFWLEVTAEHSGSPSYDLYSMPMAGGTPSLVWSHAFVATATSIPSNIYKVFADPVNQRALVYTQVRDDSGTPSTFTEELIAVTAGGTVTTVFTRTDDYWASSAGHHQLFNGTLASDNLFVVVASDGNIWGVDQHLPVGGSESGFGLWYYDGSTFTFGPDLGWTPRLLAPSLGGWIRVQSVGTVGNPEHVYGADPSNLTPVALACAADDFFTRSAADGYGVPDGYGKVVYWSTQPGTIGSWILTGTANGCATQAGTNRFGSFGAISNGV